MKTIVLITAFSLMSFVAAAQGAKEKKAVKNVIVAFEEDFNEGSFKNTYQYTTNDWQHINPAGGITRGRDEVLKEVRNVHQSFLKGVSMTIDSMTIRFITPDVAIANVIHKISAYQLPKGIKHENERQIKTYVVVKRKGRWLLIQDQNTIMQN
jgi:uncharacterized protein (TIGR02246 family)